MISIESSKKEMNLFNFAKSIRIIRVVETINMKVEGFLPIISYGLSKVLNSARLIILSGIKK